MATGSGSKVIRAEPSSLPLLAWGSLLAFPSLLTYGHLSLYPRPALTSSEHRKREATCPLPLTHVPELCGLYDLTLSHVMGQRKPLGQFRVTQLGNRLCPWLGEAEKC